MPIDVEAVRALTPGCARVTHLNYAGSALSPAPVVDAVVAHLQLEAEMGGYEARTQAAPQVDRFYTGAAELLGCAPTEIAFVENATRGWDLAFYGLVATFQPGDRILISVSEYDSNVIALLQLARQRGVEFSVVPDDDHGQLAVAELERMLEDQRVKLVAITHVPTQGGLVNPAAGVGRACRAAGVPFLLDACQSVGQLRVDVDEIGCDLLSTTGRKFLRGPRGTGLLYVRESMLHRFEPAFVDSEAATWVALDRYELRPDARRFECFERFFAGQIGLGVAFDYVLELGIDAIEERTMAMGAELRERLGAIPGVTVCDLGERKCGIVTFTVEGVEPDAVKAALAEQKVNVTVSTVSVSRFDLERRGLEAVVRASVHYLTTDEELNRAADLIAKLASGR